MIITLEKIPIEYMSNFKHCWNIHPSDLPQWRGSAPLTAALLSPQTTTLVSLQTLASKFDEGEIICKSRPVSIDRKNLLTLGLECGEVGAQLFLDTVDRLPNQPLELIQQVGHASYTRKANEDSLLLRFSSQSADEVERASRAFHLPVYFDFYNRKVYPIGIEIGADSSALVSFNM